MKAIQLKAYGNPVEYTNVVEMNEVGSIKNDEVIIKVLYSPVNPSDLLLANGTYPIHPELPSVIGGEGVGRVASIGSSVLNVKPGDIVIIPFGTFARSQKSCDQSCRSVFTPGGCRFKAGGNVFHKPDDSCVVAWKNSFRYMLVIGSYSTQRMLL